MRLTGGDAKFEDTIMSSSTTDGRKGLVSKTRELPDSTCSLDLLNVTAGADDIVPRKLLVLDLALEIESKLNLLLQTIETNDLEMNARMKGLADRVAKLEKSLGLSN